MGKKSKKSGKKALKSFVKGNKIFLAALGGAAAGITLANVLGTEKAQEMVRAVEDSVASIGDKIKNGLSRNVLSNGQSVNEGVAQR
jgi:hypothetical protein